MTGTKTQTTKSPHPTGESRGQIDTMNQHGKPEDAQARGTLTTAECGAPTEPKFESLEAKRIYNFMKALGCFEEPIRKMVDGDLYA